MNKIGFAIQQVAFGAVHHLGMNSPVTGVGLFALSLFASSLLSRASRSTVCSEVPDQRGDFVDPNEAASSGIVSAPHSSILVRKVQDLFFLIVEIFEKESRHRFLHPFYLSDTTIETDKKEWKEYIGKKTSGNTSAFALLHKEGFKEGIKCAIPSMIRSAVSGAISGAFSKGKHFRGFNRSHRSLIYSVFIVPILEEWLFRGLIYKSIRDLQYGLQRALKNLGVQNEALEKRALFRYALSPLCAALLSGWIFALGHSSPFTVFFMTLSEELLYERTGTPVACVAAHMCHNYGIRVLYPLAYKFFSGFNR